jgi:uncharacterized integral membrane protein
MGLLLAVPFLLFLLLFALSNREMVRVALWPTDWSVDVMLAVAVLGASAIAFLFGALTVWLSEFGRRRRLRKAEQQVLLLEDQNRALRARLGQPPLTPLA